MPENQSQQQTAPNRATSIERLMRPKSIVIVGMSAKPGTVGHQVLRNLLKNDFAGTIRLVGRSGGEIEGIPILTSMDKLEEGIDLAVLTLPAAGVGDALQSCILRKVGVAAVFASGFAELGEKGSAEQERLRDMVRDAGLAVVGPNCLGYTSYRDGFLIGFVNVLKIDRLPNDTRGAVAIVGQSGSVQSHLAGSLISRSVPVSFSISTGNQMDLGFGDFIDYLLDDPATNVVAIYAENIGDPQGFVCAARRARTLGKSIVLLHPGRSEKAQQAARSHTGALAGNYAVMQLKLEQEGVVVAESMDEYLDLCELLSMYPHGAVGGLGIATFSGAFCGVAQDYCEALGVDLPALDATTVATLKEKLPAYATPANPLDLGTAPLFQNELVQIGAEALLKDPSVGAVVVSLPPSSPANGMSFLKHLLEARKVTDKPLALCVLYDAQPLPEDYMKLVRESRMLLSRSSDRTIRALARIMAREARLRGLTPLEHAKTEGVPPLAKGAHPEWLGKQVLSAVGINVPRGRLARTADDARAIADEIGYPVVLKAQAAALEHKTEAGGVLLNLDSDDALARGWQQIVASLDRAMPQLELDGMLVEQMSQKGLELMVGARRDPQWGTVILVGLGGIMVEALQDVRLLPPDASADTIATELDRLRAAKLLHGFRDLLPRDVPAVVALIQAVGRLMTNHQDIVEIDINPVMVHAAGHGVTALDALVVTS